MTKQLSEAINQSRHASYALKKVRPVAEVILADKNATSNERAFGELRYRNQPLALTKLDNNMRNPVEEVYPTEPCEQATIKLRFVDGKWNAYCPEWRCDMWGNTMTEAASSITEEIDKHNEAESMAILEDCLDRNPALLVETLVKFLEDEQGTK